ncbi:hypothetical protein D9611_003380 [Ephemerocybe angulata]|uniref:PXA domain-containing protein n=1 Tax=Ephemerocybe angulata TaxID=980116 RepID=A0A8H5FH63_9AGAR|nr:hypothetical protein D9611_003380 [Tulosesus angulatus]
MTAASRHRPPLSITSSIPTKTQPQSLARRLLLPPHSSDGLPPLLALSTNAHPDLRTELYDFIALALRAYVNPWWTKLTRYDKEFLPHINRILVHVIEVLEERVHRVQLEPLAFHDLPTIITQHYVDFRNVQSKLSTSYATGGAASLSQMFGQIQPHMAISPDGQIDAEYYRQTVDLILKACLPEEDYEPDVERVIIREVVVKILVNDIFPKITQPWFIHKTILDLLGPIDDDSYTASHLPQSSSNDTSFFQSMIIIILSALQGFSGACLALIHSYKQAITTIKLVNQSPSQSTQEKKAPPPPPPASTTGSRSAHTEASKRTSSLPSSRAQSYVSSTTSLPRQADAIPASTPPESLPNNQPQDYAVIPLHMLSEILNVQGRFAATLFFSALSMTSSSMTPFLDKLLPYLLQGFLSPSFILNIARISKRTLFPNGYPGPPPIDPSPEEQAQIRAKLVAWRGKGPLSHLLPVIVGPDPSETFSAALDPLGDPQCNTRLLVFILDRVLVALFPELTR